ncbi:MAG TPA: 1,2-phenylacetyl-CoA epoxidase subunit PaaC [Casimicrobiaceae bacterium]|nr:1,2-phenylacetyl-CoA epoxidase subunit PaaC [Casimicrobiaceae bacterium]
MDRDPLLFEYLLRLGDSPLILAQRLGEWIGRGPVLEEELGNANVALDLLGQARMWLSYAGEVEARYAPRPRDEDALAFLRDAPQFRNLLLVEQPNGHYGDTLMRQLLFDAWHLLVLQALTHSHDERIAGIAAKSAKEATYHVERSGDWVIRLGDGTDDSHARMQASLDRLWTYTGEMFMGDDVDASMLELGIGIDLAALRAPWRERIAHVLEEATLAAPAEDAFMQGGKGRGGKQGVHTEHLGHLVPEMQFLQRAYPGAQW